MQVAYVLIFAIFMMIGMKSQAAEDAQSRQPTCDSLWTRSEARDLSGKERLLSPESPDIEANHIFAARFDLLAGETDQGILLYRLIKKLGVIEGAQTLAVAAPPKVQNSTLTSAVLGPVGTPIKAYITYGRQITAIVKGGREGYALASIVNRERTDRSLKLIDMLAEKPIEIRGPLTDILQIRTTQSHDLAKEMQEKVTDHMLDYMGSPIPLRPFYETQPLVAFDSFGVDLVFDGRVVGLLTLTKLTPEYKNGVPPPLSERRSQVEIQIFANQVSRIPTSAIEDFVIRLKVELAHPT